jgi:hypothetical protein
LVNNVYIKHYFQHIIVLIVISYKNKIYLSLMGLCLAKGARQTKVQILTLRDTNI